MSVFIQDSKEATLLDGIYSPESEKQFVMNNILFGPKIEVYTSALREVVMLYIYFILEGEGFLFKLSNTAR